MSEKQTIDQDKKTIKNRLKLSRHNTTQSALQMSTIELIYNQLGNCVMQRLFARHNNDASFEPDKKTGNRTRREHGKEMSLGSVIDARTRLVEKPNNLPRFVFRNGDPTAGGEDKDRDILEIAVVGSWQERVENAKEYKSVDEQLDLINEALLPVRAAYPKLVFPVRLYDKDRLVPGAICFDPYENATEPGTTYWAKDPPERRERIRTDLDPKPPPLPQVGGKIDPSGDPKLVYSFIKLRPSALSPGTRAYTRSVLYHESLHYKHNLDSMKRGWKGIRERSQMSPTDEASEHSLIYAKTIRHFFTHLEWTGAREGRGGKVAEAYNDFEVLSRQYFPYANEKGKELVVEEILGVIKDHPEATERLKEVVEMIYRPSELRQSLLERIPPTKVQPNHPNAKNSKRRRKSK